MSEPTKRPKGFQVWRKDSAVSVFVVHALAPPHAPGAFASAAPVHKEWCRVAEEQAAEERLPKIDCGLNPASPARQVSMEAMM
jgi:hypothetical protein